MTTGRGRSAAQWFCLVGGAILLVRGGVGVLLDPEFASPGEGWHQLIHLTSGAVLLAASGRASTGAPAAFAFGAVYAAITVIGIADGSEVAGVIPVQVGDNALHAILTATAVGAAAVTQRRRTVP